MRARSHQRNRPFSPIPQGDYYYYSRTESGKTTQSTVAKRQPRRLRRVLLDQNELSKNASLAGMAQSLLHPFNLHTSRPGGTGCTLRPTFLLQGHTLAATSLGWAPGTWVHLKPPQAGQCILASSAATYILMNLNSKVTSNPLLGC